MTTVDYRRAEVITATGSRHRGRFVFQDGRAALWTEDRKTRVVSRVLYVEGATFIRSTPTSRKPHSLSLATDETWTVRQLHGGGCGCGNNTMKYLSMQTALDPATSTFAR